MDSGMLMTFLVFTAGTAAGVALTLFVILAWAIREMEINW